MQNLGFFHPKLQPLISCLKTLIVAGVELLIPKVWEFLGDGDKYAQYLQIFGIIEVHMNLGK